MKKMTIEPVANKTQVRLELTPWLGEEMPVEVGTPVIVLHRDGGLLLSRAGEGAAEDWSHAGTAGDIMAWAAVELPQYRNYSFRLL